ncbi:MAG: thioredoxin [Planctomycetes bacterium]|nr:thioredoxin [Planctomycetota bacterium]
MPNISVFDTKNFSSEVLKASLPVVVDFTATWCGPCQKLAPIIEEMASTFDGRAKIGKLDIDDNSDIASQFGILSVPSVLFFRDGQEVGRVVGLTPKDTLRKKIEELLAP